MDDVGKENIPCFLCATILFCQNKNVETYKTHLVENHNVLTNLKVVISWTLLDSNIDKELKEALSLIDSAEVPNEDILSYKEETDNIDCKEEQEDETMLGDTNDDYGIENAIKYDDEGEENDKVIHLACDECDFEATTKKKLRLHTRSVHKVTKPLSSKKQKMSREEYRNSFSKSKLCPYCGKEFGNSTDMNSMKYFRKHVAKHKLDQFSCECQETWENNAQKERHMKVKHRGYIQCTKCVQTFKNPDFLAKHMEQTHEETTEILCSICGKSFKSKTALHAHTQYVHDKEIVKCDICDKDFVGSYTMKDHRRRVHRRRKCPICGLLFSKVTVHMNTVHKEEKDKKYVCDICEKGFLMERELKRHEMSVHIKARPFNCRYGCSFAYNDLSNRNAHEKKKHGGLYEEDQRLMQKPC